MHTCIFKNVINKKEAENLRYLSLFRYTFWHIIFTLHSLLCFRKNSTIQYVLSMENCFLFATRATELLQLLLKDRHFQTYARLSSLSISLQMRGKLTTSGAHISLVSRKLDCPTASPNRALRSRICK